VNPIGIDACGVADIENLFARIPASLAGKPYALAVALQAWARRAAMTKRRIRAYHRKRPHEPTISSQSALDFATELNARFNRAPMLAAYPLSRLNVRDRGLCCPRHRKALYAALLACTLTAPAFMDDSVLPIAIPMGVELGAGAYSHAAIDQGEDSKLTLMLKHGLRGATALFARQASKANAQSIATMTAGIRN
jgi:hypothetical protein